MTRKPKPYKAKSLSGAQARVRQLMKHIDTYESICVRMRAELIACAKLAADGPAFSNPLDVMDAKRIRDRVLKDYCNLTPCGTPIVYQRRKPA